MLPIVTIPAKNLREPSKEVTLADLQTSSMKEFIEALTPAMYLYAGIGIASTQVGNNVRICVIGKDAIPRRHALYGKDLILINPEFQRMGKKMITEPEGCLSVPGADGPVKRFKDILVKALDAQGKPLTFEAHGFFARVIQHEVDHMNGILFIDRAEELFESDHTRKIDFDTITENRKPIK